MNAAQQPITITAEMTPVINYALYQNELRVMRCVTVENTRETALERVTLSVSSVPAIIMQARLIRNSVRYFCGGIATCCMKIR